MYKDLAKRKECAREKQKAYRLRKKGIIVTPDALPPMIPVTPVTPIMKTKGDAEVVVRSLPRSIGMVPDRKAEMMRKFLEGK